jgi:hypothetical protein
MAVASARTAIERPNVTFAFMNPSIRSLIEVTIWPEQNGLRNWTMVLPILSYQKNLRACRNAAVDNS